MIQDPRKYVAFWLKQNNITIDERGSLNSSNKRDAFELFDSMVLDYYEQIAEFNRVADKKIQGAKETILKKALDELISLEMMHRKIEIIEKIKHKGSEDLSELTKFVKAVTGEENKTVIGVFAHFIWMIKRRLLDKDITFHIMPIIYGAQGGGKSLAVRNLFKPLNNMTLELSLTEVTDSRFYYALNKNFVVILDEMAGAKKVEVEILKKQISATHNDVRKLGTNVVTKMKQNANFIGTTNRPVNELIFDNTGARRFYEVVALNKLDWDVINRLNYIELYQNINENKENGYIQDVMSDVIKDQEKLIGVDELGAFLETYNIKPGEKEVSSTLLYDMYKLWADNNNLKNPINGVWIGRKLSNKNIRTKVKNVAGKSQRIYYINEDSAIFNKTYDPVALGSAKWNN